MLQAMFFMCVTFCLLPKLYTVLDTVYTHWLLFHMQRVIQKVAWLVQHQQITQVYRFLKL